ncbi:hypothetical protein BHM03_00031740 [Ensete ventricosum]|nr:hypothetical protein BHM03_00031740 [Ensete ventricosum]
MIVLPITIGQEPRSRTMVVNLPLAYNVILSRPVLNNLRVIISTSDDEILDPRRYRGSEKLPANSTHVTPLTQAVTTGIKSYLMQISLGSWKLSPYREGERLLRMSIDQHLQGGAEASSAPIGGVMPLTLEDFSFPYSTELLSLSGHAPWPGPSPSRPTPTVQPSTTKEAKRPSKKMKELAHKPPSSAAPNAPP